MKTYSICFLLCATFGIITVSKGYQILGIIEHPGLSHFFFVHPILKALAEAGHNVTVISFFPDKNSSNNYKDLELKGLQILRDIIDLKIFEKRRFYKAFPEIFKLFRWGKEACEVLYESESLNQVLTFTMPYDVILSEQFNNDCSMGIAHILKVPVIAFSSCAMMPWHYDRMGNPIIPSYIPALFVGHSENMNFFHRIENWFVIHTMKFLYGQYADKFADDIIRKKFGNDIPPVSELVKDTSLFFVNQHYSLSGAKPLSQSVIEVGGIHIQKSKPLETEIQQLLDSAEHGVIYISWGSMIQAQTLPSEKRESILKAISRLKQIVLLKWENDTIPHQPKNVHIRKWMPQREILCHPNVKVFMSHAGLMGVSEAVYCGVSVVATPMYGDQFLNAAALIHRGMGTLLQYEDITEQTVFNSIKKVLEPEFQTNAKKVSYSYRKRPRKALETAVWWVEHVAKTKGAPLTKSISVYMSGFIYHSLDIYLFIFSILCIFVGIFMFLMCKLCKLCLRSRKKSKIQISN